VQRREVIERAAAETFAEHGYHGASMAEIARRAGVTPPILYDHFASKRDLHRRLLERHFAELREVWREHLLTDAPAEQRIPAAIDAWFAYIEAHPYVGRMLFRDTTGDPEAEAVRRDVAARSRETVRPLLAREPGAEAVAGSADDVAMDLAWEVVRAVLQGLALWWHDHPGVPRERIVATAMNALWIGFERAARGETWQPPGGATRPS
jgi:AcrR family transcriptional regulator